MATGSQSASKSVLKDDVSSMSLSSLYHSMSKCDIAVALAIVTSVMIKAVIIFSTVPLVSQWTDVTRGQRLLTVHSKFDGSNFD